MQYLVVATFGVLSLTIPSSFGHFLNLLDGVAFLWMLSEVYFRVHSHHRGAPRGVSREKDRGSWVFLVVAISAAILMDVFTKNLQLSFLANGWTVWLAAFMVIVGVSIRTWAVLALGKQFTTVVTIEEGHLLVTQGPYRWVRHPSYTGGLISLLAFPFLAMSLPGFVVTLVLVPAAFWYRISVEEQVLTANFGPRYREYAERTWRLIPYLL